MIQRRMICMYARVIIIHDSNKLNYITNLKTPRMFFFSLSTHYLLNRFQEKGVLHFYCYRYMKYKLLLELYVHTLHWLWKLQHLIYRTYEIQNYINNDAISFILMKITIRNTWPTVVYILYYVYRSYVSNHALSNL